MANATRPDDLIDPAQHKQEDTENRSDQASTGNTRGKLEAHMTRADQHIRQSMAKIRRDIDSFKGYFRSTSSPPKTSDKQNKSTAAPDSSHGGQPPATSVEPPPRQPTTAKPQPPIAPLPSTDAANGHH